MCAEVVIVKTAIMTDTNSGFTVEDGQKLGIYVLPMPITLKDKSYLEGVGLSLEDFYRELENGSEAYSSQPSPADFIGLWDKCLSEGFDEIVYIPMSSGLSSSCSTAMSFAEDYDGRVQVVDNHRISLSLMDSVCDAVKLRDMGLDAKAIKERLEKNAYEQSIYVTVDSLKRLIKSGRVTAAGAAIATALNLKPVLQIQGEKLDAFAKVRGMKKAERLMIESIEKDIETRFSDIPREKLSIRTAGSFIEKTDAEAWTGQVQQAFPEFDIIYSPLSASICCHVGANAIGIAVSVTE